MRNWKSVATRDSYGEIYRVIWNHFLSPFGMYELLALESKEYAGWEMENYDAEKAQMARQRSSSRKKGWRSYEKGRAELTMGRNFRSGG